MNAGAQSRKESELIAAILAGEAQFYHQLIRPYERIVYMMSLSCMKNERDAEDVAQETFIRAFRDLSGFRGDSKFSTWLIGIAIDETRNRLRQVASIRIASFDGLETQEMSMSPALLRDWQELPCDVVEREEVRSLLQEAIGRLPGVYQQVFLLHDEEERDVNEVAQILHMNASLVKVTLHRARMILQRLLAPKLRVIKYPSKKAVPGSMSVKALGTESPQA